MKNHFASIKIASLIIFCYSISASAQTWSWQQVPSPNPGQYDNFLRGISAVSINEIWTVGSFSSSPPLSQYVSENLIMKWNGSSWNIYPVDNPGFTVRNLWDIEVINSNNIWAVGDYATGQVTKPQLLHYDGNNWTHLDVPNNPQSATLNAIHAVSEDDIWAVGIRGSIDFSGIALAYALHYDGTTWTEIPVPPVGQFVNHFYAIDGLSSNDVWAVGYYMEESWGTHRYMAMHWNGSTWTNSPLPAEYDNILADFDDVVMLASDDVWALGNLQLGGKTYLHWDGNSWSAETPPPGGLALAATGSNDIYALGSDIHHWDGNNWSLEDEIPGIDYPSLASGTNLPNGEIWAAGRSMDTEGNIYTLVYRYGPDLTTGVISAFTSLNDFTVLPNPVIDKVTISFNLKSEKEIKTYLINNSGQILKEVSSMKFSAGKNEFSIPTDDLAPGIYYLKLASESGLAIKKLIKI